MTTQPPKLERPPEHLIRMSHPGMVGDRTIGLLLEQGFSLVICCKDCPRVIEWTPPELARRFGDRLGLKLADLVPRLSCTGEDGCKSRDVAVFPQLYAGEWRWPRQPDLIGTASS
jgi:hypothetical protein